MTNLQENAQSTASEWNWPEWVPTKVQTEVGEFWSRHRTKYDWIKSADYYHAPALGSKVTLRKITPLDSYATGRYVHAWNNMGRVVHDDGSYTVVSLHYPRAVGV